MFISEEQLSNAIVNLAFLGGLVCGTVTVLTWIYAPKLFNRLTKKTT